MTQTQSSKFRDSMSIITHEASGRQTNKASLPHFQNIEAVAKKIVFECGVLEDHARKSSPLFVIQRAMDHSSNENACEKFHAMLHRHVSPAVASELNSLFVQVIELEKRKLISHLSSTDHVEKTKEDNGI